MKKMIMTIDGCALQRVSRWIRIRTDHNVTSRHSLYDWADNDGTVCYFVWRGQKWALNQFVRYLQHVPMFYDENGNLSHISGYSVLNVYSQLLLELSDCCEYVRIYTDFQE